MSVAIRMPQFDPAGTPGVLVDWLAEVGERVAVGQGVCRVECEKTLLELETFRTGTLLARYVEPGQAARPHTLLAVVGEPGDRLAAWEASAKAERANAPALPGNGQG